MPERVKAKCALCGVEREIIARPEPKNAREKKVIAWRCGCGAVMLRDGTSIYKKGLPPEAGADDPTQKPPKDNKDKLPKERPPERSQEDEENGDSLTIL